MRKFMALGLLVSFPILAADASHELAPKVAEARNDEQEKGTYDSLPKTWRTQSESTLARAAKAPLRAALYPLIYAGAGRIAQRASSGGKCVVKLVGALGGNDKLGKLETAGYQASDSLVNPLGTLNDGVSDAVTIAKSPLYALSQLTTRIQLCTSNLASGLTRKLTAAHPITPANHLAVYIDGGVYETQDTMASNDLSDAAVKGGIHCTPVPILNGEPESVAIERLQCADKMFNVGYSFSTYNCGGYTHDILKMAGLGVAAFENLGIGGEFADRYGKDMQASIKETKQKCDQHIQSLRKAISAMESGKDATAELKALSEAYSSDAKLQLLTSAARTKNPANRAWLIENLRDYDISDMSYFKPDADGNRVFKRGMKKQLEDIIGKLDEESQQWVKDHYPHISVEIIQRAIR